MGRTPIPKPLEYCFLSIFFGFSRPPHPKTSGKLCLLFVFVFAMVLCFQLPRHAEKLYRLLFAVAVAMCALQFAIYCPDQSARLAEQFAFPRQLPSCLRMTGTPASPASLCKLSFVGATLLRCTSATFMAIVNGNAVPERLGS